MGRARDPSVRAGCPVRRVGAVRVDALGVAAGGLHVADGDLAVAAALLSAVTNHDVAATSLFVGEIGLGGELRAVSQIERRLAEAARMGFTDAFVPRRSVPRARIEGLTVHGISDVKALLAVVGK